MNLTINMCPLMWLLISKTIIRNNRCSLNFIIFLLNLEVLRSSEGSTVRSYFLMLRSSATTRTGSWPSSALRRGLHCSATPGTSTATAGSWLGCCCTSSSSTSASSGSWLGLGLLLCGKELVDSVQTSSINYLLDRHSSSWRHFGLYKDMILVEFMKKD